MKHLFLHFLCVLVFSPILAQIQVKTYYDEDSLKLREEYELVNGVPQGLYKLYYEDGGLALKGQLKEGKKEGLFVDYYPHSDDTLRVMYYVNNLREGPSKNYFQSGKISQELTFVKNLIEGEVITYHENGKIKQKSGFEKNQPEGWSYYFDEDEKLIEKAYYKSGVIDGNKEEYDEEGNLIA